MPVYFAQTVSDETAIKIGFSSDVTQRMRALAASHGEMVLLGTMPGYERHEKNLHETFKDGWIEGEWFRLTPELDKLISAFRLQKPRRFGARPKNWKKLDALQAQQRDIALAEMLIERLRLKVAPDEPIMKGQETVFTLLHGRNPAWTRRRVRALRENANRRVDAFEIVDMLVALDVPKSKWADELAPELREPA